MANGNGPSRSPIRPLDSRPNYVVRRLSVSVVLLVVVAGAVFAMMSLVSGNAASSPDFSGPQPDLVRPVRTEPADEEPPLHLGYRDDVRYVAIYGKVDTGSLGVLGEHDVAGAVSKASEISSGYAGFDRVVVPTFEIIASVASFEAGDGDYSNETPVAQLHPWIDAADEEEMHVVLDLQPGRQSFHTQIRDFEALLIEPHVSVALDPEWRVGPNQVPEGGKVGSVSAEEVNATIFYLDGLVTAHELPPKMLIVHQFEDSMIRNKTEISGTENVQVVIHMDGFGPLQLKRETYRRVVQTLPDGAVTGWKNFYDEDQPTPTPQETMAADPQPIFISYQ